MPYRDPAAKRAYQRQWLARRRRAYFADKTCAWCASTDRLELHHRDPNAKVSHRIWSFAKARLEAELAKCIVLCRTCHQRGHAEARRVEAELRNPCGTDAAYARGCRCSACRAAHAEAWSGDVVVEPLSEVAGAA